MKKNNLILRLIAIFFAGTIISISACKKDSDGVNSDPTPQAKESFQRTFNACRLCEAIEQTSDGGFILAGTTGGDRYMSLVKTDINGNTSWSKTYGYDNYYGQSVQQTSDEGYIVAGYGEFFKGYYCVYVVKTNATGDTIWTKTVGQNESYNSYGHSVRQTTDGGYIVAGSTKKNGDNEVYLIKFNTTGTIVWTQIHNLGGYSEAYCISQTTDGGYIIGGSKGQCNDVFLLKTNSSGDQDWTRKYAGYKIYTTNCNFVQQTTDAGYIISCDQVQSNARLVKTSSNGDILWAKPYEYARFANGVQQTSDGGYIIIASTNDFGAPGGYPDIFLLKTNATGDTLWTNHFGTIETEYGYAVQQTIDGGYILSGSNCNDDIAYFIKTDINGRLEAE